MQPDKTLAELARDLERDGVLVVGTGVSIQASENNPVASWSGLLEHGIGYAQFEPEQEEILRKQIRQKDLAFVLAAAHVIVDRLQDRGLFRKWLQETVGRIPVHKRELLDSIHALGLPIATTNYDDLLTRGIANMQPVAWMKHEIALEILKRERRAVLHLHGYFDEPESVIFDVRSYEKVLASRGAQAIQQAMASRSTFLFIGCGSAGLSDPNVGEMLRWATETFGGAKYKHYCLCAGAEYERMRQLHPKLICIDYGEFDALTPYLQTLAGRMGRGKVVPALPPLEEVYGRTEEIGAVIEMLLQDRPRPLPILGGPGMGKTTIALKALYDEEVVKRYGARRWLVRCDGAETVTGVTSLIAQTMALNATSNFEAALLHELAQAPAALVIDNAETPYDAAPEELANFLARLARTPGLALIVTMRGYQKPSGVPFADAVEPASLSRDEARDVFLARAGRKKFAKDKDLEPLLAVLDGVPLALRLMGNYAASHKTLKTVRSDWEKRHVALMADPHRTGPLENIEVSFRLSIDRLRADGKRAIALLAACPGGVAHEDLQAVFARVPGGIQNLRDRAVLVDEADRIRLLAPLREYVLANIPPQPDDLAAASQHYFDLVIAQALRIGTDEGADAIARLSPEVANVEVLLARAATGAWDAKIAEATYRWSIFVQTTGIGSRGLFDELVAAARKQGSPTELAQCLMAYAQAPISRPKEDARAALDEAKNLYRTASDPEGVGVCLIGLFAIDFNQSRLTAARQKIEEAVLIFANTTRLRRQADCLLALGNIALELNQKDADPAPDLHKAIPLYRLEKYTLGEARCMKALADRALKAENDEEAAKLYSDAIALAQRSGSVMIEAHCVKGLAAILLAAKQYEKARAEFEKSHALYRRIGDRRGMANCTRGFGDCARGEDDLAMAEQWYREALAAFHQLEDNLAVGYTHRRLALIQTDEAKQRPHIAAAARAWGEIERQDLVAALATDFPLPAP
ncbi:MAG TPA: SIR2 family protein [Thermoanaerobaculia bacterium]|jgi:tetratricopeptide (TPR) repeat protein